MNQEQLRVIMGQVLTGTDIDIDDATKGLVDGGLLNLIDDEITKAVDAERQANQAAAAEVVINEVNAERQKIQDAADQVVINEVNTERQKIQAAADQAIQDAADQAAQAVDAEKDRAITVVRNTTRQLMNKDNIYYKTLADANSLNNELNETIKSNSRLEKLLVAVTTALIFSTETFSKYVPQSFINLKNSAFDTVVFAKDLVASYLPESAVNVVSELKDSALNYNKIFKIAADKTVVAASDELSKATYLPKYIASHAVSIAQNVIFSNEMQTIKEFLPDMIRGYGVLEGAYTFGSDLINGKNIVSSTIHAGFKLGKNVAISYAMPAAENIAKETAKAAGLDPLTVLTLSNSAAFAGGFVAAYYANKVDKQVNARLFNKAAPIVPVPVPVVAVPNPIILPAANNPGGLINPDLGRGVGV